MTNDQTYFLKKLQEINQEYLKETEMILVSLYHRLLHDNLALDDLIDIGNRFNLDIEDTYHTMIGSVEEDDSEGEF
jgi:hypothetical protein